MNKQEWFAKTRVEKDIESLVEDLIVFSSEHNDFMRNCGLYAVGSSLTKENYKDVDVTLVGLDFRKLFKYDWVFLKDPLALVENEIVVPEKDDSASQTDYEDDVLIFEGKRYRFNTAHPLAETYSNFYTCSGSHIEPTELILDLTDFLLTKRGQKFDREKVQEDLEFNPCKTYVSDFGLKFVGINFKVDSLDFFIHGEHMLVNSWKKHQEQQGWPYLVLHEWEQAGINSVFERRNFYSEVPVPEFIDYEGKRRSAFVD